jgi:tRNA (cmo5U34)-methyltransferase
MAESVDVFASHAPDYHGQRRRIVPSFDLFYGTAVDVLGLRDGRIERVLDLGAGTGLMGEAVLARYPLAHVTMLDGAAEMLAVAEQRLPERSITTVVADLRDELPEGPFDAVVSALAIHHLEHEAQRDLLRRVTARLRPGGVFVDAEHMAGPTPWLDGVYRRLWRVGCERAGAEEAEIAAAEERMLVDRSTDAATLLGWMGAAGFADCDCFFKHLHFAVLAGWRS